MYINGKYIPLHLRNYIVEQNYEDYTAIEHASWRFIMRISKKFFEKYAHGAYLSGLDQTGITTDSIPRVEEMNEKLAEIGWAAACVRGFIHPVAFMEFQSLGILPIAADMRTLDHLTYTPAPDIVHEAAGHAPILADPKYSDYVMRYGNIARKAIMSQEDLGLYEAIRELSDKKENPNSTGQEIRACEKRLSEAREKITYVSEAAYLTRMNWWTVEYGLFGELHNPKIYGAGLLSSVGESYNCISAGVKKYPFDIRNIEFSYDITEQQPQLFVVERFEDLGIVLEEFAKTMAWKKGGTYGLDKAKRAATVCTVELDSGIQISGKVSDFIVDESDKPVYLSLSGPVQLAQNDKKIPGHGGDYHSEGYGTALGNVKKLGKALSACSSSELKSLGLEKSKEIDLYFESGVRVKGRVDSLLFNDESLVLVSFTDCKVSFGEKVLFMPEWGVYDMCCGMDVVSVFGGAADLESYYKFMDIEAKTSQLEHKLNHSEKKLAMISLHQKLRDCREVSLDRSKIEEVLAEIDSYEDQWLIRMELLELLDLNRDQEMISKIESYLEDRIDDTDLGQCIRRGLEIYKAASLVQ